MNIHALRLFYYVAETGSVTKAAARLRISQPAVTSQIKRLEKDLGLPLCSPSGRGISLTPFGTELAKQAGNLFTYEERIEEFVEDYRQGRKGKLRIAATYLPAGTFGLALYNLQPEAAACDPAIQRVGRSHSFGHGRVWCQLHLLAGCAGLFGVEAVMPGTGGGHSA